jgi:hypothetical protein
LRIVVNTLQYGGHWGPGTMAYFQSQNKKIEGGSLKGPRAKHLNLDTLGMTNGCIDSAIEGPLYPEYAFNNTYGFQLYPEEVYLDVKNNVTTCLGLVDKCRILAAYDAENIGTNDTINAACAGATLYCYQYVQGAYALSGVGCPAIPSIEPC